MSLASTRHVGTEPRDGNPLSGGLRTRLWLGSGVVDGVCGRPEGGNWQQAAVLVLR